MSLHHQHYSNNNNSANTNFKPNTVPASSNNNIPVSTVHHYNQHHHFNNNNNNNNNSHQHLQLGHSLAANTTTVTGVGVMAIKSSSSATSASTSSASSKQFNHLSSSNRFNPQLPDQIFSSSSSTANIVSSQNSITSDNLCSYNNNPNSNPMLINSPNFGLLVQNGKFQVVEAVSIQSQEQKVNIFISTDSGLHGSGAFGQVYHSKLLNEDDREVAIKQVQQDKRYRNRELPLMKKLSHQNIVSLLYYFYTTKILENNQRLTYLNLVMEFIPHSLNYLIRRKKDRRSNLINELHPANSSVPFLAIKLCMYQIFRALAYIHSRGICHRDIKPNNLLFDPDSGVLKVCDFGSAKCLIPGDKNVSYICARYYRAPELLFGATDYSNMIDLWSTGVVFSELLLGYPIFHEESGIDQLVLIISKLGTPTKEQIRAMNKNYAQYDLPPVYPKPLPTLFNSTTPSDALDLIANLFQYDPNQRIRPLRACAHQFFDELREPGKKWTNGRELPPLFDFSTYELDIEPNLKDRLMPFGYRQQQQQQQQHLTNMPIQQSQPQAANNNIQTNSYHFKGPNLNELPGVIMASSQPSYSHIQQQYQQQQQQQQLGQSLPGGVGYISGNNSMSLFSNELLLNQHHHQHNQSAINYSIDHHNNQQQPQFILTNPNVISNVEDHINVIGSSSSGGSAVLPLVTSDNK